VPIGGGRYGPKTKTDSFSPDSVKVATFGGPRGKRGFWVPEAWPHPLPARS